MSKKIISPFRKRASPAARKEGGIPKKLSIKVPGSVARYVVLVLGLWTLLSFFFHIEYFPSFDLQTATSLLISLAFVTVPLTAALSFLFLTSHLLAGLFIRTRPTCRSDTKFKHELFSWTFFSGMALFMSSLAAVLYSVMQWPVGWSLIAYLSTLVLLILLCYKGVQMRHQRRYAALYADNASARLKRLWDHRRIRQLCVKQVGGALLVGLLQVFPLSIFLLYLSRATELKEDNLSGLVNAVMFVVILTAPSAALVLYVGITKKVQHPWIIIAGVFLFLPALLGFFTQSTGMVPMTIARITKMGNVRAAKLVLSKDACPIVSSALGLQCNGADAPITICNVHIMSRVGAESFLKIPSAAPLKGLRPVLSVFIPSAAILSLQVDLQEKTLRTAAIDTDLAKLDPVCPSP